MPPVEQATPDAQETLADWLHLALTPGIGPVHGSQLLARIGSPGERHRLPIDELARALGSMRLARALMAGDAGRDAGIAASLAWQRADPTHHLISRADPRYPPRLLHLADAPLLLYVCGDPACLSMRQLAIVGSRRATALGLATATSLAEALARSGWVITSGLAEGIDRAAHEGALRATGGTGGTGATGGTAGPGGRPAMTVAVMGTGADRIYPARHRTLAGDIVAGSGALVTELPPGTGPVAANFPRRNRLIAALAEGVLVVEAAKNSGSLITARLAADLGREVLAVPGSIHSPQSRGCHRLLRDGAALVETLDDVLDPFRNLPPPALRPRPGGIPDPEKGSPSEDLPHSEGHRSPDRCSDPEDPIADASRLPATEMDRCQHGGSRLAQNAGRRQREVAGQRVAGQRLYSWDAGGSSSPAPGAPDRAPASRSPSLAPPVVPGVAPAALAPASTPPLEPDLAPPFSYRKSDTGDAGLRHHCGSEQDADRLPDPESQAILALLNGGPVDADRLLVALAWPVERLLARLLRLELDGFLARDLTGQWFRIR